MSASIKPMNWVIAIVFTFISAICANAQQTHSADPLAAGGCLERTELETFVRQNEGKVIFTFNGNITFNTYSEDTRISFVRYRFAEGYRSALVARDRAYDTKNPNDKSKVCVLFAGDDRGSITNPREGLEGTNWWYQDYQEDNAVARCKQIRPAIYSMWSAQLDNFGDQRISRREIHLIGLLYTEGSADKAKQMEREQLDSLATSTGDNWCASPLYLKNRSISDDKKLIALLTGKRFVFQKKEIAEPAVLLAIYVPRKAGPESLGWTLHIVQPSGAAYRLASGRDFHSCEECFSKTR